jgi:hypothetical protein
MKQEDIICMAKEAGLFVHKEVQPELLAFANLVAAAEREACAKLCESADKSTHPADLANVIRERGEAK